MSRDHPAFIILESIAVMKLLAQILTIYSWGAVCILLLFLFGIARFFERRLLERNQKDEGPKTRSYYPFFLVPVALFAVSALIYVFNGPLVVGSVLADILRILGALVLVFAGYSLLNTMMGGKH